MNKPLFKTGEIGFYKWEPTGCLDKNQEKKTLSIPQLRHITPT
jgi:hypothetical protein